MKKIFLSLLCFPVLGSSAQYLDTVAFNRYIRQSANYTRAGAGCMLAGSVLSYYSGNDKAVKVVGLSLLAVGAYSVFLVAPNKLSNAQLHFLPNGFSYDLFSRKKKK